MKKFIFLVLAVLLVSGCASSLSFEEAMTAPQAGFWSGLWHGLIILFSFIGSLFSDDIAIYAINNNGGWYDFGFFLGISITVGSSSQA